MAPNHVQDDIHAESLRDPETFWMNQASHLVWARQPICALERSTKKLQDVSHDHWAWFPGGEINTTYNCVDRHVEAGNGNNAAICYDSPVTKKKERFTYNQVLVEVEHLAGVLREEGVRRGDVVLIYMPMIPAAIFGMLASARLGAIHAVVFGGFAPQALAQRVEASRPKVILTASCGIEGLKEPTSYRPLVRRAIEISKYKPEKVLIWQREELRWDDVDRRQGESQWARLVKSARNRGLKAACVPVKSEEALYIIYTSGTTGLPKGVVRNSGGHAVNLHFSMKYLFGIHGPGDTMFCASDIGWVVGHSYIVYAPLLVGATTLLFEGKPVGTPDAGTFWRILEEYQVNSMFTAPTALRAIRNTDNNNEFFKARGNREGLRNLRALFLAGERSEPSIVTMYQNLLVKYCAPNAVVIDNWWSSESGSPITGLALSPMTGKDFQNNERSLPISMKPGSAGKPCPGFDVQIVDDDGEVVPRGTMGNIVLGVPLAPSAFTTLWEDEQRFYSSYLKRFAGKWVDTGDAGMLDQDGFVHVMSRSDDIINVAAHRFSTGSIEQAVSSHPSIAECCVVGIPDALKGQLPFAFVILSGSDNSDSPLPSEALLREVQNLVRDQIGGIASLGGMLQGKGMIPKTRSGKTLRRVLRELIENGVHGDFDKEVGVPSTIEDYDVVIVARQRVKMYFQAAGKDLHKAIEPKCSKL
ncbi:propionyl-CoA synthetase [Pseudovirgaria hyperparasitica]|uniref:Propionyl-CoA synthetase n=1 Tax=Pseudovirgaria hyperparasitica TaxID=470096 RepID=A0A6A6VYR6_9PEZI|nr:propionyl-CoA synthetase [Pseudovirgaria hyperparasitica]KAF2755808.1 propionyl-CoA synthetase [Pseudovirgaria hyperparasitica]